MEEDSPRTNEDSDGTDDSRYDFDRNKSRDRRKSRSRRGRCRSGDRYRSRSCDRYRSRSRDRYRSRSRDRYRPRSRNYRDRSSSRHRNRSKSRDRYLASSRSRRGRSKKRDRSRTRSPNRRGDHRKRSKSRNRRERSKSREERKYDSWNDRSQGSRHCKSYSHSHDYKHSYWLDMKHHTSEEQNVSREYDGRSGGRFKETYIKHDPIDGYHVKNSICQNNKPCTVTSSDLRMSITQIDDTKRDFAETDTEAQSMEYQYTYQPKLEVDNDRDEAMPTQYRLDKLAASNSSQLAFTYLPTKHATRYTFATPSVQNHFVPSVSTTESSPADYRPHQSYTRNRNENCTSINVYDTVPQYEQSSYISAPTAYGQRNQTQETSSGSKTDISMSVSDINYRSGNYSIPSFYSKNSASSMKFRIPKKQSKSNVKPDIYKTGNSSDVNGVQGNIVDTSSASVPANRQSTPTKEEEDMESIIRKYLKPLTSLLRLMDTCGVRSDAAQTDEITPNPATHTKSPKTNTQNDMKQSTSAKKKKIASAKKSSLQKKWATGNWESSKKSKKRASQSVASKKIYKRERKLNDDVTATPKLKAQIINPKQTNASQLTIPHGIRRRNTVCYAETNSSSSESESPKRPKVAKSKKRIEPIAVTDNLQNRIKRSLSLRDCDGIVPSISVNDSFVSAAKSKTKSVAEVLDVKLEPSTIKNNNPEWHCLNQKLECLHCDKNIGISLANHYVTKHRDCEVFPCRLSPEMAEYLRNTTEEHKCERQRYAFKQRCYFCDKVKTYSKQLWLQHLSVHTGCYEYKCKYCLSAFAAARREHACGPKASRVKRIKYPPFHRRSRTIYGYLCDLCNFIQFKESLMEKHLRCEHDDCSADTKFKEVILATFPKKKKNHEIKDEEARMAAIENKPNPFICDDDFIPIVIKTNTNNPNRLEIPPKEEVDIDAARTIINDTPIVILNSDDDDSSIDDDHDNESSSLQPLTSTEVVDLEKSSEIIPQVTIKKQSDTQRMESLNGTSQQPNDNLISFITLSPREVIRDVNNEGGKSLLNNKIDTAGAYMNIAIEATQSDSDDHNVIVTDCPSPRNCLFDPLTTAEQFDIQSPDVKLTPSKLDETNLKITTNGATMIGKMDYLQQFETEMMLVCQGNNTLSSAEEDPLKLPTIDSTAGNNTLSSAEEDPLKLPTIDSTAYQHCPHSEDANSNDATSLVPTMQKCSSSEQVSKEFKIADRGDVSNEIFTNEEMMGVFEEMVCSLNTGLTFSNIFENSETFSDQQSTSKLGI